MEAARCGLAYSKDVALNNHRVSTEDKDLLRLYFADIGRYPLLTRDDEVCLARQIEEGNAARKALHDRRALTPAEERELQHSIRLGTEAQEAFVQANLRLVVSIARRYRSPEVDLLDLIQEGNFGLMRAVEKYNWRMGFKFSTYATWWIRQSIARGIACSDRTIRIPRYVGQRLARMQQAHFGLASRLGRSATIAELSAELGLSEDKVAELLVLDVEPASLSEHVGAGAVLADTIADPLVESPSEAAARAAMPAAVAKILAPLNERERMVITLRFGLDGEEPRTLAEVGAKLGLTAERIRQIEGRAIAGLRSASNVGSARDLLTA
jgi:RNA polymerase sigma factor (sigma-70 family)